MKRLAVLASMAALALGVAACGGGTPGQPEPTTVPSSDGDGTNHTPSMPSGNPSSGLGSMNACSLLNASEATSVGLPSSGQKQNAGAKSGCEWDGSEFSVGVTIRTNAGLTGVMANGGTLTGTKVGNHQAMQLKEAAGGCLYALGVTGTSRVDVNAQGLGTEDSCPEALSVAELVEKKLPLS